MSFRLTTFGIITKNRLWINRPIKIAVIFHKFTKALIILSIHLSKETNKEQEKIQDSIIDRIRLGNVEVIRIIQHIRLIIINLILRPDFINIKIQVSIKELSNSIGENNGFEMEIIFEIKFTALILENIGYFITNLSIQFF